MSLFVNEGERTFYSGGVESPCTKAFLGLWNTKSLIAVHLFLTFQMICKSKINCKLSPKNATLHCEKGQNMLFNLGNMLIWKKI